MGAAEPDTILNCLAAPLEACVLKGGYFQGLLYPTSMGVTQWLNNSARTLTEFNEAANVTWIYSRPLIVTTCQPGERLGLGRPPSL